MAGGIGAAAADAKGGDFSGPMCIHTHEKSADVIRKIEAQGWVLARINGSHHHFRHKARLGTVTIPHPVKDLPIGTLKSIERQSGVNIRG